MQDSSNFKISAGFLCVFVSLWLLPYFSGNSETFT